MIAMLFRAAHRDDHDVFGGLALFYVLMTRAQGGGNNIMNFGKSRARTNMDGRNKVTFADVAGAEEEKEELKAKVQALGLEALEVR